MSELYYRRKFRLQTLTIWTTNEAAEVGRVREEKGRKRSEKRKEEERGSKERKGQ